MALSDKQVVITATLLALIAGVYVPARAQSLMGRNLIVNGDAETDQGVTSKNDTKTVPPSGWKVTGSLTAAQYDGENMFSTRDGMTPPNPGKNYFAGGPESKPSSAVQIVDVAAEAAAIDGNSVVFTLQGYIGGETNAAAELKAVFKKADGTVLLSTTPCVVLGDDRDDYISGILLRVVNGLVPAGTRTIEVQLNLSPGDTGWNSSAADNLSLIINKGTLYGANLIQNGDAETIEGKAGKALDGGDTIYPVPGWNVRGGMTVVRYNDASGFPSSSDSGPIDRGAQLFAGGTFSSYFSDKASGWQTFELTGIASTIDVGAVSWDAKAWLGGYSDQADNTALLVRCYDAAGKLMVETQVGPVTATDRGQKTGLLSRSGSGAVPAGTRHIEVWLVMSTIDGGYDDGYADNVSFVLTSSISSVVIKPAGIVNAASGLASPLAPGEIISIYGSGLGPATPLGMETDGAGKMLSARGGVNVSIGGVGAPLLLVQSGQINALVPFDVTGKGSVQVVVDNNGSKSDAVDIGVANTAPGIFTVDGTGKNQGVIINSDFTLNSATNAAARGSTITILCTGLGQTTPGGVNGQFITGGTVPKAAATPALQIGGQAATVQFAGVMEYGWPGIYQLVVTVPAGAAAGNAVPVVITGSNQTTVTMAVK